MSDIVFDKFRAAGYEGAFSDMLQQWALDGGAGNLVFNYNTGDGTLELLNTTTGDVIASGNIPQGITISSTLNTNAGFLSIVAGDGIYWGGAKLLDVSPITVSNIVQANDANPVSSEAVHTALSNNVITLPTITSGSVQPNGSRFDLEDGGTVQESLDKLASVEPHIYTPNVAVDLNVNSSTFGQLTIFNGVNDITDTAPVITLIGPASIDVNVGDTFVDPGYTATDIEDGDVTYLVSVSFFETTNGGNVVPSIDTSTAGEYLISYYVEDSDGNTHSLNRAVNVIASVASFRSVVFDIADNWGDSSLLGIRSIEFKLNGVVINSTGLAGYATTQFNAGLSAQRPFLNPSKIGNEKGWLAASGTVQNQRLQVTFTSILQFDEIVINNQHSSGSDTDWGARNIVITGSTDEITDTTYGAPIANSTELFDGVLAQHVASDAADDQTIWTA